MILNTVHQTWLLLLQGTLDFPLMVQGGPLQMVSNRWVTPVSGIITYLQLVGTHLVLSIKTFDLVQTDSLNQCFR